MANDGQDQSPKHSLYLISSEEMKLLLRLRQLHAGAHLVIIQIDGDGVCGLTVLNSGKVERLRKGAGLV